MDEFLKIAVLAGTMFVAANVTNPVKPDGKTDPVAKPTVVVPFPVVNIPKVAVPKVTEPAPVPTAVPSPATAPVSTVKSTAAVPCQNGQCQVRSYSGSGNSSYSGYQTYRPRRFLFGRRR